MTDPIGNLRKLSMPLGHGSTAAVVVSYGDPNICVLFVDSFDLALTSWELESLEAKRGVGVPCVLHWIL